MNILVCVSLVVTVLTQSALAAPGVGLGNSTRSYDLVFVTETAAEGGDFDWRGVNGNRWFMTKFLFPANLSGPVNVGLVVYNENSTIKLNLDSYPERGPLYRMIDNDDTVPMVDYTTSDLSGAMTEARTMVNTGRSGVEKLIILITRGRHVTDTGAVETVVTNIKSDNTRLIILYSPDDRESNWYKALADKPSDYLYLLNMTETYTLKVEVFYG